jgi:sterol 3beta-glucosyltransferase
MPWPRVSFSLRRSEDSKSIRSQSRRSPSSSSEEPEDDKTPQADKETNPPPAHDPSLTKLFSDAASYNQILNTHTDVAANDTEGSLATHDSPNGFSQLIGRDLEDHERVASETIAQLSVSNWAPGDSTDLAPDDGVDEPEGGPPEGEPDKAESSGVTLAAVEPESEDKLKPDEILDLLQQDFGALAPPGEEKLLLETDATLFQEVVVLVCQFIWDNP